MLYEVITVQREGGGERGALPGARAGGRTARRRAPARSPEVPRQPRVRGRGDGVNYNVGHLFSLSPVLDNLTARLARIVKTIRGEARLTEANIQDALREVRVALLEADVALPVVRDFVARVREKALGEEVIGSLTPGQAAVGVVHRELVALMGEKNDALDLATQPPAVILLAGLQGRNNFV